jgi:DCN1-like protein 1/2
MFSRSSAPKKSQIDTQFDQLLDTTADVDAGDRSSLDVQHLATLAGVLAISEDDIVLYIIAWKLGCKVPHHVSRDEWTQGFARMRIDSLARLQASLTALRAEMIPAQNFRDFYFFIFDWTRESPMAKYVTNEVALVMWPLLFNESNFKLLPSWLEFIASTDKPVSKDVWRQTLDFAKLQSLSEYDPSGSWPSLMDNFVTWMENKK